MWFPEVKLLGQSLGAKRGGGGGAGMAGWGGGGVGGGGGLFAPGAGRVASERGPLCGASAHFYFVIKHFLTLWGIYDVYRNKVVHVCVVCLCSSLSSFF